MLIALTTGAKIYYLAGVYIYMLAAGAVAIDQWLSARKRRLRKPAAGHRPDRGGDRLASITSNS